MEKSQPRSQKMWVEKKILNQFTILSGELDRLRKDLIEEALIEYLKKYTLSNNYQEITSTYSGVPFIKTIYDIAKKY